MYSPAAIDSAPASSPARPLVSTTPVRAPAPATPSTRLRLDTSPSLMPNTPARRLPPSALRCRAPTSDSDVGIACPATLSDAL